MMMSTLVIEAAQLEEAPYVFDHPTEWYDYSTGEWCPLAQPEPLEDDGPDYEPPFTYHPCA